MKKLTDFLVFRNLLGWWGRKGSLQSPQLHPSRAPGSILSPENGNSTIRSRVRPPSRSKPPEISLPQLSVYNTPSGKTSLSDSHPMRNTQPPKHDPPAFYGIRIRRDGRDFGGLYRLVICNRRIYK